MPMVSLTIDHMRHQIIQALDPYFAATKKDVETAVNEAVKSFDFKRAVQAIVERELRTKLEGVLQSAVTGALHAPEVEGRLYNFMKRSVDKAMAEDSERRLGR